MSEPEKKEINDPIALSLATINQKNAPSVRMGLLKELNETSSKSLVLRAEQKVPLDEVVYVMDLANKNGIKVVLAVDSK